MFARRSSCARLRCWSTIWRRIRGERFEPPYRVITARPHRLWRGGSPGGTRSASISMRRFARSSRCLLTRAPTLVGYSYGGGVALRLALALPDGSSGMLTLIEPVFFSRPALCGRDPGLRPPAARARGLRGEARRRHPRKPPWRISSTSGPARAPGKPYRRRSAPQCSAWLTKSSSPDQAAFAFDPGLAGLAGLAERTPAGAWQRSPEPMIRLVEALHRLMPRSRRTIIDGAIHMLPLTHAPALSRQVLELLSEDAERRLR